jgi:hypothetical protein
MCSLHCGIAGVLRVKKEVEALQNDTEWSFDKRRKYVYW